MYYESLNWGAQVCTLLNKPLDATHMKAGCSETIGLLVAGESLNGNVSTVAGISNEGISGF